MLAVAEDVRLCVLLLHCVHIEGRSASIICSLFKQQSLFKKDWKAEGRNKGLLRCFRRKCWFQFARHCRRDGSRLVIPMELYKLNTKFVNLSGTAYAFAADPDTKTLETMRKFSEQYARRWNSQHGTDPQSILIFPIPSHQ